MKDGILPASFSTTLRWNCKIKVTKKGCWKQANAEQNFSKEAADRLLRSMLSPLTARLEAAIWQLSRGLRHPVYGNMASDKGWCFADVSPLLSVCWQSPGFIYANK
ncbi:MAG: hypothetical protein IJJ90_06375 [Prevotella sp.]|nr:hypothetical protein [Prevotella sp.]